MRQRRTRTVISVAVLMAVLIAFTACGSDSPASSGDDAEIRAGGGQAGLLEDRLITNTSEIYTMDDLVAIGFKKSKQFSTETLPAATDVWYGFFNQRDIEVRVYESHEDALVGLVLLALARATGVGVELKPFEKDFPELFG